jgi:hypothetical protein
MRVDETRGGAPDVRDDANDGVVHEPITRPPASPAGG